MKCFRLLKKHRPCPDPVLSKFWPQLHSGVISEKMQNSVSLIQQQLREVRPLHPLGVLMFPLTVLLDFFFLCVQQFCVSLSPTCTWSWRSLPPPTASVVKLSRLSHILQDCPLLDQLRWTTCLRGRRFGRSCGGCLGELQGTFQFFSSSGLQVWWQSKRRRRSLSPADVVNWNVFFRSAAVPQSLVPCVFARTSILGTYFNVCAEFNICAELWMTSV